MTTGANNYIERNPQKCFSMPSLVGRRLTVYNIVCQVLLEGDIEGHCKEFELKSEQIEAALKYCSNLSCTIDNEQHQFCDGCILREIRDRDHATDIFHEIEKQSNVPFSLSDVNTVEFSEKMSSENAELITWPYARLLLEKYFSEK